MKALLFLLLFIALPTVASAESNTIALVGSRYGKIEAGVISRMLLAGEEAYLFETHESLPAEAFTNYPLVILTGDLEKPYTTEEHEKIATYLENGGHIILIQGAPKAVADATSQAAFTQWSGIRRTIYTPNGPEAALLLPGAPLLHGVWAEGEATPAWATANMVADWEPEGTLIGTAQGALAAHRHVGKGSVAYLGHHLFRLRKADHPAYADSGRWVALLRNFIHAAGLRTLAEVHSSQLRESATTQGARIAVWSRPWQRKDESGPHFIPPLPAKEEELTELSGEMALNETEFFQVNLTGIGTGGTVSFESPTGTLPEAAFTWYAQDAPPPIPWPRDPAIAKEAPYWLIPLAKANCRVEPGQTRIFWLEASTRNARPGAHTTTVRVRVDGKVVAELPLHLKVYPVKIPQRRMITLMPFGHVYGDVLKPAPALRFKRNLEENGYEWSFINAFYPQSFRLVGHDRPLDARAVEILRDELRAGREPEVDFRSMEPFIDAAIAHNLTRFTLTPSLTESIDSLTKKARLNPEEADLVSQWYLRAALRYFQEHGIGDLYVRFGDELSQKELEERFIPWAQRVRRAGWQTYSSFTGYYHLDPALNEALSGLVDCWTLNRTLAPHFVEAVRAGKLRIAPHARTGSYGGGGGRGIDTRRNLHESLQNGWEAWQLGYDHVAPNPYFKGWLYYLNYRGEQGISGERYVSYLDQDDLSAPLVNSPWLLGIRESMEAGNLAAMLDWTLTRLEALSPEDARKAATLRERARAIVGDSPGEAPLHWHRYAYKEMENNRVITGDPAGYREAKKRILDLLDEARLLTQGRVKPNLYWNHTLLVENGQPRAAIVGTPDQTGPLVTLCEQATGTPLPVVEPGAPLPHTAQTLLLIGTPETPGLAAYLPQPQPPRTTRSYWITPPLPGQRGRNVIWLGAHTPAQLQAATHRFGSFLQSEGMWFHSSP